MDPRTFLATLVLLVFGLIFEASGFGAFVAGRPEGLLIVFIGITMFWGGWTLSKAKSLSCGAASALNMADAALTVAYWNFEVNPVVVAAGPLIFLLSKVACSVGIVFFARVHPRPRGGGLLLMALFGAVVAWNIVQHAAAWTNLVYGAGAGPWSASTP